MAKRDEDGRITAESKLYKIAVGNFNSANNITGKQWLDTAIFNVSDSLTDKADHWFPINEIAPWSYAPFFWFKKLADREHRSGRTILVHCHAGIHRSKMMAYFWLQSLGLSAVEAASELGDPFLVRSQAFDEKMGYIPTDVLRLYRVMSEYPTYSLAGCLRELGVPNLLTNTSPVSFWTKLKKVFTKI